MQIVDIMAPNGLNVRPHTMAKMHNIMNHLLFKACQNDIVLSPSIGFFNIPIYYNPCDSRKKI